MASLCNVEIIHIFRVATLIAEVLFEQRLIRNGYFTFQTIIGTVAEAHDTISFF